MGALGCGIFIAVSPSNSRIQHKKATKGNKCKVQGSVNFSNPSLKQDFKGKNRPLKCAFYGKVIQNLVCRNWLPSLQK